MKLDRPIALVAVFLTLLAVAFAGAPAAAQSPDPAEPVPWGTPGGWAPAPVPLTTESVIGADNRVQILNTSDDPWRRNVQLEMTFPGGSFICSGFLLGPNIVGTAGHCVYNSSAGGWATSVEVIPGRNGTGAGSEPFGRYTALNLWSVNGWVVNGDPLYDYGAVILGTALGYDLSWYHLDRSEAANLLGITANISGYPGDKPFGTQWYHFGTVTASGDAVSYNADTAGGQSGSAVYWIGDDPRRYVFGVHAYGVGGSACLTGNNCGARMRDELLSFYTGLGAPIFSSGFETGDFAHWSTAAP